MRTMYDSVAAVDIPAAATMVAGYVDGLFAWDGPAWGRFGNAVRVRIAIRSTTNDGVVGDVETGDMLPWELPAWVQMRRAAGIDPTGYVNLSNWSPTRTEFALRGIPEPHWWLADYDGVAALPVGAIAKQYANPPLSGGHYDLSAVANFWPGVDLMLKDLPVSDLEFLAQLMFRACYGHNASQPQLDGVVGAIQSGTPLNQIYASYSNNSEGLAWAQHLLQASPGAVGPQGPPGPKGDTGPQGPATPLGPFDASITPK